MKLLRRIRNIVNSNLHAMVACAEDPEKLLQQCISDMQDQAGKARAQVTHAIAAEKKLARLAATAEVEADRLASAAAAAAEGAAAGQDPDSAAAAREAVRRHLVARRRTDELQSQWNQQLEGVSVLKKALGELQAKIEEARRRKDVLIARKRTAQAKRDIHSSLSGIAETNSLLDTRAFEAFDRVAEQVETAEAHAEAAAEVSVAAFGPSVGGWAAPDVTDAEVDAALAGLQTTVAPTTRD